MVTFKILVGVIIFVAFLLVVVIMVQQPKGGGLSSTFGGNAQVVGGVKKTTDFLDKSTWTLGTILIVGILLANIVIKKSGVSVNDSILIKDHQMQQTPVLPVNESLSTPQLPENDQEQQTATPTQQSEETSKEENTEN